MKIYDLTHVYDENMSVYSEEEKISIYKIADYEDGYSVTGMSLGTHTGTHIDVAKHIFRKGKSLDQYNLNDFIGSALIINCCGDSEITLSKIKKAIEKNNKTKYIIFYTGYDEKWGKKEYLKDYPILTDKAVNFLGNMKDLVGIGVDCISVDNDESLKNHQILLKNDKLILENLCNLEDLKGIYKIIISPMKLKNVDGAPIRVYLLDEIS